MPRLSIHYDLRHPAAFGVSGADLYATALDQIAWVDKLGFATVGTAGPGLPVGSLPMTAGKGMRGRA